MLQIIDEKHTRTIGSYCGTFIPPAMVIPSNAVVFKLTATGDLDLQFHMLAVFVWTRIDECKYFFQLFFNLSILMAPVVVHLYPQLWGYLPMRSFSSSQQQEIYTCSFICSLFSYGLEFRSVSFLTAFF